MAARARSNAPKPRSDAWVGLLGLSLVAQFADRRRQFRGRCRRRVFDPADDGAAYDDAVDGPAQHADVRRLADAEADAQRQLRLPAQPGELVEQFFRQLLALARDPGDADA